MEKKSPVASFFNFFCFVFGLTLAVSISFAYFAWGCLLIIYLVHCFLKKDWPRHLSVGRKADFRSADRWWGKDLPFFWFFVAYAAWGLIVSLLGHGVWRSLNYWRADLLCFVFWTLYLVFVKWPKTKTWMLRGFWLGFVFLAVAGIAQFVMIHWLPEANVWLKTSAPGVLRKFAVIEEHIYRVHGHIHTLTYAEVLALAAIFAFGMRNRWRMLLQAIFLAAVLASASRGPLFGYIGGFVVYLVGAALFRKWGEFVRLAIPIVLASLVVFSSPYVRGRILSGFTFAGHSDRLTMWKVGFKIIRDHPVFGVGIAHVRSLWKDYTPKEWEVYLPQHGGQQVWSDVHSLYLQQASERGIPGLAVLLLLLLSFPLFLWRSLMWLRARGLFEQTVLGAWAVSLAFLLMNVTESAFQDTEVVFTLYVILTLAFADFHAKIQDRIS